MSEGFIPSGDTTARTEELRKLIADAERYRWLNSKFDLLLKLSEKSIEGHGRYENVWLKCGEALDRWIDERIEDENRNKLP